MQLTQVSLLMLLKSMVSPFTGLYQMSYQNLLSEVGFLLSSLLKYKAYSIATITYQFPAGGAKKGESSEAAARRELEEETGYVGGKVTHLTRVSPFAHKMTDLEDVYLIEGVTPDGVALDEEEEQINVVLKTPAELREMIANNEIKTAISLVGGLLAINMLGLD